MIINLVTTERMAAMFCGWSFTLENDRRRYFVNQTDGTKADASLHVHVHVYVTKRNASRAYIVSPA